MVTLDTGALSLLSSNGIWFSVPTKIMSSLKLALISLASLFWGFLAISILHGMIYFSFEPLGILPPLLLLPWVMLAFTLYLGVLALRSPRRFARTGLLYSGITILAVMAEFALLLPLQ